MAKGATQELGLNAEIGLLHGQRKINDAEVFMTS
jgi:hypothetical protein